MFKTIPISQYSEWDKVLKNFNNLDVYYLSEYVKAFQIHGDGEPILLQYTNGDYQAICVMMRRDIALDRLFYNSSLPHHEYYDLITPYGYGGFIFNSDKLPQYIIDHFNNELVVYLKNENYVSAFFRFHPIIKNALLHSQSVDIVSLGKTIAMDLTTPELIWQNITSKNRNVIRKAEKSGIIIKHGKGIELLRQFKSIYDETMRHDNADDYYYFKDQFYLSISEDLINNYELFYAEYQNEIISIAIIIFEGNNMHYHLSGSKYEYRCYAPSNLLLYKAALWGYEQGYKIFHLGGGVGSGNDSLYKFKAAFNRNSDYQFAIGKLVINKELYSNLMMLRGFESDIVSSRINFFPQYRAHL